MAVQFEDCEIKQARRVGKDGDHAKGQTTISESAKTFDVASIDFEDDSPSSVTLSELDSTNIWDRVSVNVKVLMVMDPVSVPGGKRKQDVVAADSTGVGKSLCGRKALEF